MVVCAAILLTFGIKWCIALRGQWFSYFSLKRCITALVKFSSTVTPHASLLFCFMFGKNESVSNSSSLGGAIKWSSAISITTWHKPHVCFPPHPSVILNPFLISAVNKSVP